MLMRPQSLSWKRRRTHIFLLCLIISTTIVFILYLPSSSSLHNLSIHAATLHNASEAQRATLFANALAAWNKGPPTTEVIIIAAACTPRDVTEGLLRQFQHTIQQSGVIDIGANKGYPVTRLALSASPKWVISVEPDDRNYKHLTRLQIHHTTMYKPIHGAVSSTVGHMQMAFHKDPDDFTCFNCSNTSREEVSVHMVDVHTVDSLVQQFDGNVALLKTDTQGHEAAVLTGAHRLLASGRVQAVLMEFDPKLLRTWENAEKAVSLITSARLRCISLVFAGLNASTQFPFFGREVTLASLPNFWQYVITQDKYTDLFCLRR